MGQTSIEQLDLNLLKVLKALGEEQNTRRAAEVLNITQPSVSHALGRLRIAFDDELFIRNQYGLSPTNKGQQLLDQLPEVFQSLETFMHGGNKFVPSEYTGDIKLALNSFMNQSLSTEIYKVLHQFAPNASIRITTWTSETESHLRTGVTQIGVNYASMDLSKEIRQIEIAEEEFVVCCRSDHPLKGTEPNIEQLAQYPLVVCLVPEMNTVKSYSEQALLRAGYRPNVLLRTDVLNTAFEITAESDALLPLSSSCITKMPNSLSYFRVKKDISVASGKIALFVSNKNKTSQYYQWLLEALSKIILK